MSNPSTSPSLFEAVRREASLADQVAAKIERLILDGRVQTGEALPPERELARQFGVSRTVVREAVRGLVARQLLEVRPGSGTLVSRPTVQKIAQSISLLLCGQQTPCDIQMVLEVRRLLETEIAVLAAQRRTDRDLDALQAIMQEAEMNRQDRDRFAQSDVAFHQALAHATHNPLYDVLLQSISDVMLQVRQMGYGVPGMPERGLYHHRAILAQVVAADPAGARQAMLDHLAEAEQTMESATTQAD